MFARFRHADKARCSQTEHHTRKVAIQGGETDLHDLRHFIFRRNSKYIRVSMIADAQGSIEMSITASTVMGAPERASDMDVRKAMKELRLKQADLLASVKLPHDTRGAGIIRVWMIRGTVH